MRAHLGFARVNHAGECGAIEIYAAQMAVARWRAPGVVAELAAMRDHETAHRDRFAALLAERDWGVCPRLWLWRAGGWCLGAITALGGAMSIWATTAAVETAVRRHLDAQLARIGSADLGLRDAIEGILADEDAHRDHALAALGPRVPAWRHGLEALIGAITHGVIVVGQRLAR